MACPTCNHTIQHIETIYWCPRCGTIKTFEKTIHYIPTLIEKCKDFELTLGPMWNHLWTKLGIKDSISKEN